MLYTHKDTPFEFHYWDQAALLEIHVQDIIESVPCHAAFLTLRVCHKLGDGENKK